MMLTRLQRTRPLIFPAFLILQTLLLPLVLFTAWQADQHERHTIAITGDDWEYISLAVNLARGVGYTSQQVLPRSAYPLDDTTAPPDWLEQHRLDSEQPVVPVFYRVPAWPMMLAALFVFTGPDTLSARLLMAVLGWATGLLALLLGRQLSEWPGTLAGGITGTIYTLSYLVMNPLAFQAILSENSAAFWLMLFCLLIARALAGGSYGRWAAAGLALAALMLMRGNTVFVLPLLGLLLILDRSRWKQAAVLGLFTAIPLIAWSIFASLSSGSLILLSTQSHIAFADGNNVDTLNGVGPQHREQGSWNPGWKALPDGTLVMGYGNSPRPGENGWLKGLAYWQANPEVLPRLFYVKLVAGFWYLDEQAGSAVLWVRLYIAGIGFILIASGAREGKVLLGSIPAAWALRFQLALLFGLILLGNLAGFLPLLIGYTLLGLVALLRAPMAISCALPFARPDWALALIGAHFVSTLIFFGYTRYREPLDPVVILSAWLGLLMSLSAAVQILQRRYAATSMPNLVKGTGTSAE